MTKLKAQERGITRNSFNAIKIKGHIEAGGALERPSLTGRLTQQARPKRTELGLVGGHLCPWNGRVETDKTGAVISNKKTEVKSPPRDGRLRVGGGKKKDLGERRGRKW